MNCGLRIWDCGLRTDLRPPACAGPWYETKPIVQNKPNWARPGQGWARGAKDAKQSQFAGKRLQEKRLWWIGRSESSAGTKALCCGQVRQTNPICPAVPGGAGPEGRGMWGQVRQTNPIARSGAPRRCPAESKEGQRLGRKGVMVNSTSDRRRPNEANSGYAGRDRPAGARDEGRSCDIASMPRFGKQTQSWAGWDIWGMARGGSLLCETNPIRCRRAGYPIIPVFYRSTIPVRWQSCKTNPIRGGARWAEAWGTGAWEFV
jgi:hypothetical protein